MSEIASTKSAESILINADAVAVSSSKNAMIDLVGLRRVTHQLAVPIPTPSPFATEMPALRGPALALVPMEPVILMPPVVSTEKSVRSMAGQTSMSIDRLTGKQTPTCRSKGKSKAVARPVSKAMLAKSTSGVTANYWHYFKKFTHLSTSFTWLKSKVYVCYAFL